EVVPDDASFAMGRGPFPELLLDDFVKSPTSALRFIALSLRRTIRTPRDTRFARLEFGTFYKVVRKSTSNEVEFFICGSGILPR
ncbi:MAG: hypothetical protein Q7U75_14415, partial [Desulfobacterales bacterium]|nr:hypothetical protein [Desulfobacterales bacterium]